MATLVLLAAATAAASPSLVVTLSANPSTLSSNGVSNLQALVTGSTASAAVTWAMSPSLGTLGNGNAPNAGGISTNTYTAPPLITLKQTVTITATSVEDHSQVATVNITLNAVAVTVSVTPATIALGAGQTKQFSAAVTGTSVTGVTWSLSPAGSGTIDQTGLYQAPALISANQTVTITATSVFETAVSGTATVTLQAITVAVSPTSVSLTNSQTQQFSATVTGSSNTLVTWTINPQTGTIDNSGLYTAPQTVTGSPKVTVTAVSTADSTKSATATVTLSTFIDIGTGAATPAMQQGFQAAFYRNGFNTLVSLPPLAQVARLGTTGYIQRFADAAKDSGVTLALVTASASAPPQSNGLPAYPVVQLYSGVYAYYNTVGATAAGYPFLDTQNCPAQANGDTCTYDLFDKSYGLFVWATPLTAGQNFTVSGGFYTTWNSLGGIATVGPPVDTTVSLTASSGTTAVQQAFSGGALYTIGSGANRTLVFGVLEPIYDLYLSSSGPAGSLGLPTSNEFVLASGVHRQTFEGGALEYTPGTTPVVRPPVASVVIAGVNSGTTLTLGSTLSVTATAYTSTGLSLTDRAISWSTSNGSVIAIQASGATAVLRAIGGGTAKVTAASEGITSATLPLMVLAPCCQIGDGAPDPVQQAFQTALTRDQVVVQVPVASSASRTGSGYVQIVESADPTAPVTYMIAEGDSVGTAYLISGALLAYYLNAGGPAGALGYPVGDASAGGTQIFQNGALAGNPVRTVSGGVLAKWKSVGLEIGAAGAPNSEAVAFATFGANSGTLQSFVNGVIYAASAGPLSGQAYFVSGLILARYTALGGAAGGFGMPASDEFVSGTLHQQNFEGGIITYNAGDSAAQSQAAPKVPAVMAPASVTAGGTALLAIVGFPNNHSLRVSVTGEPDFLISTATGAYSWGMFVPLGASSATVSVHVADTQSTSTADGSFAIKGFDSNRITITKVAGDLQNGPPGAQLPVLLTIALLDSTGAPVVGVPVTFQGSAGVQLAAAAVVTNSLGQAQTAVRMPAAEGVALVTANAPSVARIPVTFSLTATAASLNNFLAMQQAGSATLGNGTSTIAQKGALLTAVASILRYRQNRGELPAPHGMADPGTLNQFLQSFCATDSKGNSVCDGFLSNAASGEQVVNLWRAAAFTGGTDIKVDGIAPAAIVDRVALGAPVLLSLGLSLNGSAMGGTFVVATGVAADGSITIQDPNPLFGRSNLNDYLNGFTGTAGAWQGTLVGAFEFALTSPPATRFVLGAISQPPALMQSLSLSVSSTAGACGAAVDLWDAVDSAGNPASGRLVSRVVACDGGQPAYQIQVGANSKFSAFLTDLASGGGSQDLSGTSPGFYQATRPVLPLVIAPVVASIGANAVVNSATFAPGIAPGGLMSIFGMGLSGPGATTTVDVDGTAATVLFASSFQVNAQVPATVAAGSHTLHVRSAFGTAQAAIAVAAVQPEVFLIGTPAVGAVTNQDGSLNTPQNPLPRGQVLVVYCTGLGAVTRQGAYSVATTPATVVVNGVEMATAFAGLTPGFTGLYQVNVVLPASMAPSLGVSLALKQGGELSNAINIAVQ